MNKKLVVLNAESSSLMDLINVMNEKRIGSVLISSEGKTCGIITERNIFKRIIEDDRDPQKVILKDLMKSPLITINKDDKIEKAIQVMVNRGIRYLIVVDKDNPEQVEGIISNTDILNLDISKIFPKRKIVWGFLKYINLDLQTNILIVPGLLKPFQWLDGNGFQFFIQV